MIKVSVIIPVYNVSAYLRQCLDSVSKQTLSEIEVICIDDGSTDDSLSILQEYEQSDPRFHVLTQKNCYAGVARNRGLEQAQGEYVIFWDADDYFALDALELLYQRAKAFDADICICDAQNFDTDTGKLLAHSYFHKPFPEEEVFSVKTFKERFFTFTSPVIWNKLIRRNLLLEEEIRFQDIQHINDALGTFLALVCAKRIVLLEKKLIYYRVNRADSLVSTYGNKNDSVFLVYRCLKDELEKRGVLEDEEVLRGFHNKVLGIYLYTMKYCNTYEQCREYYQEMKEKELSAMGMAQLPEGYIFNQRNEEKYHQIMNLSVEEYLFSQFWCLSLKNNELRQVVKDTKSECRELKKAVRDSKKIMRTLQKEKNALQIKLNQSQAECNQLRKKEENQQKVIEQQERRLHLKSVRFGLSMSRVLGRLRSGN
ncbi:MAG: glycosyltransferase [Lachnospiraceae bacterium]|nr:glycosyltransferase [Lachnospiraceae bacterium]